VVVVASVVVVAIVDVVEASVVEVVAATVGAGLTPRPEHPARSTAATMTDEALLIGSGYRRPEETRAAQRFGRDQPSDRTLSTKRPGYMRCG
jgi:hypothetical protein